MSYPTLDRSCGSQGAWKHIRTVSRSPFRLMFWSRCDGLQIFAGCWSCACWTRVDSSLFRCDFGETSEWEEDTEACTLRFDFFQDWKDRVAFAAECLRQQSCVTLHCVVQLLGMFGYLLNPVFFWAIKLKSIPVRLTIVWLFLAGKANGNLKSV